MEYSVNRLVTVNFYSSPSPPKPHTHRRSLPLTKRCRLRVVVAGASGYSLNTPVEPVTPAGRFLSSVLMNERTAFHDAVAETLEKLVADVDEACKRRVLTAGSSEGVLHRRIADLKAQECKTSVEDVMYMLIFYKFSELRVHLIPPLSKCIYNNRLEILPSKDWELESIHTFEILEMIREYLTFVIGWRSDFNVTETWATTKIKHSNLCQIYTASILFGYFLKSTSIRHQLELMLVDPVDDMIMNSYICRTKNLVFGYTHNKMKVPASPFDGTKERENLLSYLNGFTPDSLAECAQPNSKEALNLITKHTFALFGDVESENVISTSFATLKRLVLEAIAFGSFLWDTEEYVKTVYTLEEIN
ncbi:UV-B-induced protein At3g17800, chloroplastic-like [Bidens hawaiensis]|uniref:UV-B-induced protein At3g17800, chloroplastic-like n=1 Tax=Bidens hawaiensis TaxID=980011 RepID=UPI0040493908